MKRISVILALLALVVAGLTFMSIPGISARSSSAKLTETQAKLRAIARTLLTYYSETGALPDSLDHLVRAARLSPRVLHSPFDPEGTRSFRYAPAGFSHPTLDRRILVYCTSEIPEQLRSADGEPDRGYIPVIFDDFSIGDINDQVRSGLTPAAPFHGVGP